MERHLLLSVSEQQSAFYGVRFVEKFFSNKEGLKLTLFYTTQRPAAVWAEEHTHESLHRREQQAKQYQRKGRKALDAARAELIRSGFKEHQINTRLQFRQYSKVMDIIQEGEGGLYDAVVLGRRGLSWLMEAFDESVTKGLLESQFSFPLWICRNPNPKATGVLLCMDGSDAAYRMADHVGFMLAKERKNPVTLFVVKKDATMPSEKVVGIFSKGTEILTHHGFPNELIKTKAAAGGNVAKAIMSEAQEGKFAALALGRTGAGQGLLERIFMGSVSNTLFRELERGALWVCR